MKDQDILILKTILKRHLNPKKNRAFIFGSQATKKSSRTSDLDVGVIGQPLAGKTYFELKADLEESNLPFTVDLVDFNDVSDTFKQVAEQKIVKLI